MLIPNFNNAKETLIYADNIDYDKNETLLQEEMLKFADNEFIFRINNLRKKLKNYITNLWFLRDEKITILWIIFFYKIQILVKLKYKNTIEWWFKNSWKKGKRTIKSI